MCEMCRYVRKESQIVCSCNCYSKIGKSKRYHSRDLKRTKCMSCGHYLGRPKSFVDALISITNRQNMQRKEEKKSFRAIGRFNTPPRLRFK